MIEPIQVRIQTDVGSYAWHRGDNVKDLLETIAYLSRYVQFATDERAKAISPTLPIMTSNTEFIMEVPK